MEFIQYKYMYIRVCIEKWVGRDLALPTVYTTTTAKCTFKWKVYNRLLENADRHFIFSGSASSNFKPHNGCWLIAVSLLSTFIWGKSQWAHKQLIRSSSLLCNGQNGGALCESVWLNTTRGKYTANGNGGSRTTVCIIHLPFVCMDQRPLLHTNPHRNTAVRIQAHVIVYTHTTVESGTQAGM